MEEKCELRRVSLVILESNGLVFSPFCYKIFIFLLWLTLIHFCVKPETARLFSNSSAYGVQTASGEQKALLKGSQHNFFKSISISSRYPTYTSPSHTKFPFNSTAQSHQFLPNILHLINLKSNRKKIIFQNIFYATSSRKVDEETTHYISIN